MYVPGDTKTCSSLDTDCRRHGMDEPGFPIVSSPTAATVSSVSSRSRRAVVLRATLVTSRSGVRSVAFASVATAVLVTRHRKRRGSGSRQAES
ncbi:hypothetical protein MRX96_016268 [Rhipicephalus microplus]